jgi:hypothetical protein
MLMVVRIMLECVMYKLLHMFSMIYFLVGMSNINDKNLANATNWLVSCSASNRRISYMESRECYGGVSWN